MMTTAVFFVTCSPGSATHFADLGKNLAQKSEYTVSFVAAGAATGPSDKKDLPFLLDFS